MDFPTASTHQHHFVCSACGKLHAPDESEYTCLACGPRGILEPAHLPDLKAEGSSSDEDFEQQEEREHSLPFTRSPGIWRYEKLLCLSPVAPRSPLLVGATPLLHAQRLGQTLGLPHLYIKNDSLNPTGSLKDRASAVALARAAEIGARRVAVASTGNAGSSLAGLAASMGIPAAIFVPASAPRAKLIQALLYGAQVFAVQGSYDDAFELCLQACDHFGWYNRNTAYNPYTIEGKKTVAYEIYEQLGNTAPDAVFVPTGDGCILSGVARGFRDLQTLGMIDRMPRLVAVQAEGANAIARALAGTGALSAIEAHSVADSISVDVPRNGAMAVRDVRRSGGRAVVVSDEAILAAVRELAATTGIFAEPAAAASLAGLRAYLEEGTEELAQSRHEIVVLLVTGTGLKDVDAATRASPAPIIIEPSLRSLEAALKE
jgi:threonine synthase